MTSSLSNTPAFGRADLSNCELEQIHLAGSIQPHGALLVLSEPDQRVVQASANAREFLGLDEEVLDRPLASFAKDLSDRLQPLLDEAIHLIPWAVRCKFEHSGEAFDGLVHRAPDGGLVIELEKAGDPIDPSEPVEDAVQRTIDASSIRALCDEAARIFKKVTGYDRVMVYRFDDDGHGEVFSEEKEAHLEPFLGNRYPATDIPQIARGLYIQNRVRVLVDTNYTPVPLAPRLSPLTGGDLDMSLCFLRSMSPIHIQYLKNMGVGATLVASLVVGGKLWGLVSCHHYEPRFLHYQSRAICELLAEIVATRIAALESFAEGQAQITVRRIEQRLVQAVGRDGDWRNALFDRSDTLLKPLSASGAAVLFDDEVLTAGDVPGTHKLREIRDWLDEKGPAPVLATASLGEDDEKFKSIVGVACGLIASTLSSSPGEYIIWFRPERIRTVIWGGDPNKPMHIGNDPSDLSPRRSFAQWHQVVEGTSDPWKAADLAAARMIGETLTDVLMQFRSVRMLIAQDQLEAVSRQVRQSDHPVVIAEPGGRILLTNEAFQTLLPSLQPHTQRLEDLPALFSSPGEVRRNLSDLVKQRRAWRGEITLVGDTDQGRPLLVRADPVLAGPDRVLGFVILFTDLTERHKADQARRRFIEATIERRSIMNGRLNGPGDGAGHALLGSFLENAQIAALEIGDGVDPARMPELLQSVQVSLSRSADLLDHLLQHSSALDGDSDR